MLSTVLMSSPWRYLQRKTRKRKYWSIITTFFRINYHQSVTLYWFLKNTLLYELALVPLALFHPTGEMRKTNNSEILKPTLRDFEEICKNKVLLVINFTAVLQGLSKSSLKTFGDLDLCLQDFVHQCFKESNL